LTAAGPVRYLATGGSKIMACCKPKAAKAAAKPKKTASKAKK
jgi:hypothetical protein